MPRVTNIELFLDLVYVFAVTQLSHYLIGHSTLAGALHAGLLLAMVWLGTRWRPLRGALALGTCTAVLVIAVAASDRDTTSLGMAFILRENSSSREGQIPAKSCQV